MTATTYLVQLPNRAELPLMASDPDQALNSALDYFGVPAESSVEVRSQAIVRKQKK